MMLHQLVANSPQDVEVLGLCDDSRQVRPGDLFCAMTGEHFDGRLYAEEAVSRGAVAVLAESPLPTLAASVPVVAVDNLSKQLGHIASRFFGEPSEKMQVIAVTGTNGKTSFTQMQAQAIAAGGHRAGVIGTMGHGLPGELREPGLTTPPPVDLQRRLKALLDEGCETVVMEASSHGIVQQRLAGTDVDVAVLTNITHDHLDYHGSFAAYREAKSQLFRMASVQTAVINRSDDYASELMALIDERVRIVTYSVDRTDADVRASQLGFSRRGISARIELGDDDIQVNVPLFGAFNLENLLAVIAVLYSQHWSAEDIRAAVESLTPVAGRMQWVAQQDMPVVLVDYAHTPDALEKALEATRMHFPAAAIHVVFGCGGDRDRAKRPMMGAIAARLADRVVITSDNPRSEDPRSIISDIESGTAGADVTSIVDRRDAILDAISHVPADGVVLVAGKGHENYQELSEGRIAFSDVDVVHEAFVLRSAGVADGEGA